MLLNAANHVKAYIMTIQMAISDLRQAALDAQNFTKYLLKRQIPVLRDCLCRKAGKENHIV